ncbi:MAG TPA: hypothetical protein VM121_00145 [Acidimicrobiales bacterium]|nr:hypothetical protein [Acidimicrobiales bacterium]
MVVNGLMLANELRRRRVGSRTMVEEVESLNRSAYVMGELRTAPTSQLLLAAMSMTGPVRREF